MGSRMRVWGSWHQALCGGPHSCCCLPTLLPVYGVEGVGRLPLPQRAPHSPHTAELPPSAGAAPGLAINLSW